MDLVYITSPSQYQEIELRYSIRSMAKYLRGFERIFIVGNLPPFLKNVYHLPVGDPYARNPARNIYEKILAAACHPYVSEQFGCCSDDYFLLQEFDLRVLPNFHLGTLEYAISLMSKKNYYKAHVEATYGVLHERGLPTLNYNVHFPIVYDKQSFTALMPSYDWDVPRGYISKSLYANSVGVAPGKRMQTEVKFYAPKTRAAIYRMIQEQAFFTTDEKCINEMMLTALPELYPEPTEWEN